MFRVLLDPQCIAPSCLSPFRGYSTAIMDNVFCLLTKAATHATRAQRFRRTGRTELLLFGSHLYAFWQKLSRGPPRTGPQHSPLVLASAFKFSRPQEKRHDEPRIASGSSTNRGGSDGAQPFHLVTKAYPLPGRCPRARTRRLAHRSEDRGSDVLRGTGSMTQASLALLRN